MFNFDAAGKKRFFFNVLLPPPPPKKLENHCFYSPEVEENWHSTLLMLLKKLSKWLINKFVQGGKELEFSTLQYG